MRRLTHVVQTMDIQKRRGMRMQHRHQSTLEAPTHLVGRLAVVLTKQVAKQSTREASVNFESSASHQQDTVWASLQMEPLLEGLLRSSGASERRIPFEVPPDFRRTPSMLSTPKALLN